MRWVLLLATSFCAYGQHFEVATIKLTDPAADPHAIPRSVSDPGRFERRSVPLAGLITIAYRLKGYQLVCPPSCFSTRYDVLAKIPDGATPDEQAVMLQNLLAERFGLKVHRENKEMTVYGLTVAKGGPKFQECQDGDPLPAIPPGSERDFAVFSGGTLWVGGFGGLIRDQLTMQTLAQKLERLVAKPVHDETGLEGKYNLLLRWGQPAKSGPDFSDDAPGGQPGPATGLFGALQSQLGLKLEAKKGQVEVLVLDHAEKLPTEN